jgi:hypothetical protein
MQQGSGYHLPQPQHLCLSHLYTPSQHASTHSAAPAHACQPSQCSILPAQPARPARPSLPSPHLDLRHGVEAIQLIEQLKHGTLDLTLATGVCVVALGADGIDLICTQAAPITEQSVMRRCSKGMLGLGWCSLTVASTTQAVLQGRSIPQQEAASCYTGPTTHTHSMCA